MSFSEDWSKGDGLRVAKVPLLFSVDVRRDCHLRRSRYGCDSL